MDPSLYRRFAEVEDRHWWFVARRTLLLRLIRETLGPGAGRPTLDVGCGTGAFLGALAEEWDGWGVDTSPLAVAYARQRGLVNVVEGPLEALPHPDGHFTLITALDVIEHVEDDAGMLERMGRLLATGGRIVLTVPAYPWLWSRHDEINHHHRRYTRGSLERVLAAAGLSAERLTYFNTLLFPLALVHRALARATGSAMDDGVSVPPGLVNSAFRAIFEFERHLIGRVALPFGLSLLAVVGPTPSPA